MESQRCNAERWIHGVDAHSKPSFPLTSECVGIVAGLDILFSEPNEKRNLLPTTLLIAGIALVPLSVLTAFTVAFMRSRAHVRRAIAAAENAGVESFVQTGAGQIGWLYATMPLVRILVTQESVLFAMPLRRTELARSAVTAVSMAGATRNAVRFKR